MKNLIASSLFISLIFIISCSESQDLALHSGDMIISTYKIEPLVLPSFGVESSARILYNEDTKAVEFEEIADNPMDLNNSFILGEELWLSFGHKEDHSFLIYDKNDLSFKERLELFDDNSNKVNQVYKIDDSSLAINVDETLHILDVPSRSLSHSIDGVIDNSGFSAIDGKVIFQSKNNTEDVSIEIRDQQTLDLLSRFSLTIDPRNHKIFHNDNAYLYCVSTIDEIRTITRIPRDNLMGAAMEHITIRGLPNSIEQNPILFNEDLMFTVVDGIFYRAKIETGIFSPYNSLTNEHIFQMAISHDKKSILLLVREEGTIGGRNLLTIDLFGQHLQGILLDQKGHDFFIL